MEDDEPVKGVIVALNVARNLDPVARLDLARVDQVGILPDRVTDALSLRKARREECWEVDCAAGSFDADGVRILFGRKDGRVDRCGCTAVRAGRPLRKGADGRAVGEDGFARWVVEPVRTLRGGAKNAGQAEEGAEESAQERESEQDPEENGSLP